ncbi:MAG: DUF58 domain-containing protein, partial [Bacteroidota bacterium]
YLTNAIKKRSTAFLISDFMDENEETGLPRFDEAIRIANKKHDVIGLRIYDKREFELPSIGLIRMRDAETGDYAWVDTSSEKLRKQYTNWYKTMESNVNNTFLKAGIDYAAIATGQDYVKPLINLFKKR